jgi:hypothetical protein
MEVHHHAHTPRRKWTHYFWEFLMLFLAVTLGFLVENQREHYVEHKREGKFMFSLTEDLKQDVMYWDVGIKSWQIIYNNVDTLCTYVEPPFQPVNAERAYLFARRMKYFEEFIYNDKTIEQLRSAGNYRLVRKQGVVNNLNAYDNLITDRFRKIEEDARELNKSLCSLQSDLFIFKKSQQEQGGKFPVANRQDLLARYYNELLRYRSIADRLLREHKFFKGKAEELIKLIEEKYHFH